MAFDLEVDDEKLTIRLSGADLLTFRRRVEVPLDAIVKTELERRGDLEPHIESRIAGIGTNYGWRLTNLRRVGPMLRRGTVGQEFWAVRKGSTDQTLLVCHLNGHPYARLVLDVDDPEGLAARLRPLG